MKKPLALATRDDPLGCAHARSVADALRAAWPELEVRTVALATEGYERPANPLEEGRKEARARAIRSAVLRGDADIGVIPFEEVPLEPFAGLHVAAVPARGDPRDAMVARPSRVFAYLPEGARIGTTGPSRRAQLLRRKSDLQIVLSNGDPDSLIARLDAGEVDAVVVSAAALRALGQSARVTEVFETDLMIPLPGQGALALEARDGDSRAAELLAPLDDPYTAYAVRAERTCFSRLGGGPMPISVHAATDGEIMSIHGIVATPDGSHAARLRWSGPWREAEEVGATLAELLLAAGAREILAGQPLESTGRYTFRPVGTGRGSERWWQQEPAADGDFPDEEL